MAWIESHQSLLNHRKTGRLARALNVSKVTAVGHLHAFWWWCMDNAPTGMLAGIDPEDIADGAAWEGEPKAFIDALVYAGFVDSVPGEECVHDWMDYAGKLIEKREKDAERKRLARHSDSPAPSRTPQQPVHRTSTGHPADGAGTVPNRTVPHRTEPEDVNSLRGEGVQGEAAPGADAPPPNDPIPIQRASRAERETRIPSDFPITAQMADWAAEKVPELDLDYAHEEFCTYWRGKGGKNLDWEQTWRNGMLKAYERRRMSGPRYLSQADMNSGKRHKFVGA